MKTLDYHPLGEIRANHRRFAGPRLFVHPTNNPPPTALPGLRVRRWSTLDFTAPLTGAENKPACAWCDREQSITRPPGTSHGICERHAREMREQLRRDAEARRPGQPCEIREQDARCVC